MIVISGLIFERFLARTAQKDELESTVDYLARCFSTIVKSSETTLICFSRKKGTDFGYLAGEAVKRCGGLPVFWEDDLRWKTLLLLAFRTKASTIIAPPMIVLGVTKIARYEKVPLHFYNVIMSGYPCLDWIMDGIAKGLDCRHWGVFAPGISSAVTGFTCDCGTGLHLRDDKFTVEILSEQGQLLPPGSRGRIVFRLKDDPQVSMLAMAEGAILSTACPCGNPAPKLVDIGVELFRDSAMMKSAEELLLWSSVLDCVFTRTRHGMELEVVCFPGEKLPVFPSCAKLQVRSWNPEQDYPLPPGAGWGCYDDASDILL